MGECFDNTATPVFSITICVWGAVFLELWKRKHSTLQHEWDVDHYDENEPDRPQFYGTTVIEDPVTKLQEVLYPFVRKLAKFTTSLLFVFTMILVVLASLVGVIIFRLIFEHDWLSQDGFEGVPADRLLPILTASVLNGISILVLKQLYNKMAVKLTDWGKHAVIWRVNRSVISYFPVRKSPDSVSIRRQSGREAVCVSFCRFVRFIVLHRFPTKCKTHTRI
jgi:anoctamin-5